MIAAPTPENESARLAQLKDLHVLDTPLDERFERITRLVCRTLGVPIAAVSLVDANRQWFKSIQGLEVSETPRDISFCGHAIMQDSPFIVNDALEDERFKDNPLVLGDPKIRFYAGCPLTIGDGKQIGTLCAIDREPREIGEDELETLRDLALMVESELQAIALSEAHGELLEDLRAAERAALIDPMTRTWNRRGGEQMLKREWESMLRKSAPITIAILDIDHFKKVNDTHGHDAGDEVIRQVAKALLKNLRPSDVLCRWGGEEFLLLFPECGEAEIDFVLHRLIKAVGETPADTAAGVLKVTASIGAVVTVPTASDCANEFVKYADIALYKAKENGRNRCEMYDFDQADGKVVGF